MGGNKMKYKKHFKLNNLINTITNIDDLYNTGHLNKIINDNNNLINKKILNKFYDYVSNIINKYNIDDIEKNVNVNNVNWTLEYQYIYKYINKYYNEYLK